MATALIAIYIFSLIFIFFYSLMQLHLVIKYVGYHWEKKKNPPSPPPVIKEKDLPVVTIQLPVYNEIYVVERLIDSVVSFDYPREKLEIQVLDDSTDETLDLSSKKVARYQGNGVDIKLLTRKDRTGFKAGALAMGLKQSRGEFIAIFDADFVPEPDFLKRTIPYFFTNPKLGAIQTRWEHLNKNYSLLTRIQAFALDAHFTIEQQGRNAGGYFINFNGTAGVWRRECINDAGGWEADTLTEDLDLSYRAQIKGWKFKYLEDVTSPAELPMAMGAVKSQQFRWSKGGAETARKNLARVWRATIPLSQKIHGTCHLMSSLVFILVLCCSVLSVPVLLVKSIEPSYSIYFRLMAVFLLSLIILSAFYFFSLYRRFKNGFRAFFYLLKMFPMFLAMSMGISLHNTIAVVEGLAGFKSPFIRTPKFNISSAKKSSSWKKNKYLGKRFSRGTWGEMVLTLYFFSGVAMAFLLKDFALMPFHLMLTVGYGLIFYYSVTHVVDGRQASHPSKRN